MSPYFFPDGSEVVCGVSTCLQFQTSHFTFAGQLAVRRLSIKHTEIKRIDKRLYDIGSKRLLKPAQNVHVNNAIPRHCNRFALDKAIITCRDGILCHFRHQALQVFRRPRHGRSVCRCIVLRVTWIYLYLRRIIAPEVVLHHNRIFIKGVKAVCFLSILGPGTIINRRHTIGVPHEVGDKAAICANPWNFDARGIHVRRWRVPAPVILEVTI